MSVYGSIALALGLAPVFFSGFAMANDVGMVREQLNGLRMAQLDNEIFDAYTRECQAIRSGDRQLAFVYEQRVQDKLPEYRSVTKHPYQLQPCP